MQAIEEQDNVDPDNMTYEVNLTSNLQHVYFLSKDFPHQTHMFSIALGTKFFNRYNRQRKQRPLR